MRAIDADALIDVLAEMQGLCQTKAALVQNSKIWQQVKDMPTIEPERKKGKWIETAEEYYKAINEKGGGVDENTDYFTDDIACSECLAKFSVIDNEAERFDFCPNCGAEMEVEE